MGKFIDLTGKRFGRLVVLGLSERRIGVKLQWRCVCDCGKEAHPQAGSLRNGSSTSCGCFGKEQRRKATKTHGLSKSPEYMVWYQMHERCSTVSHMHYQYYGGRGIKVCDKWQEFEGFLEDMGRRPFQGAQLDRIDPNGNYEKANCRWVTAQQNSANRRGTLRVVYNGQDVCLAEAARMAGVAYRTAYSRYRARNGVWL